MKDRKWKAKIRLAKNPGISEKEKYRKLFSVFDFLLTEAEKKDKKVQKVN